MKFKAWLVENGIAQKEIAELLNISIVSVNRKLNGTEDFTIKQIRIICEKYKISADEFFLLESIKKAT